MRGRLLPSLVLALALAACGGAAVDQSAPAATRAPDLPNFTVISRQYVQFGSAALVRYTVVFEGLEATLDFRATNSECNTAPIGSVLPPQCR